MENLEEAKKQAEKKLEDELKKAENKPFADPVIGYLLKRCGEDGGLAQDVVQEHKTWQKCFDYIYSQARKQLKGNCTHVCDDVVYEWAEDYYRKDDKAEEEKKAREKEKKAKEAAKRRAEIKKELAEKRAGQKDIKPAAGIPEDTKQKKTGQPKKNSRDIEGQLDMFSMIEA